MKIRKHLISLFLTIFVIGLIILSGPASAVTVDVSQPNDANKGADVSFSVTIDINDPDAYVPINYGNVVFSGPNGFSKTCKINTDETDDCDDVDFTITSTITSGKGYGYGYDSRIGYGYDFGYGYGFSNGQIKIDAVWHTPSDLTDGTYTVKADVHAEGSVNHDFSSSTKSFSISTASTGGNAAPSHGGVRGTVTETAVPTPAPVVVTPTPTATVPTETGGAAETGNVGAGPTGAAVTGNILTRNPIATSIVVGLVVLVGLISYFTILKKKKY